MQIATENNDVELADFVESKLLAGQVEDIKKVAEYVAELRRLGKGHARSHFFGFLPFLHQKFRIIIGFDIGRLAAEDFEGEVAKCGCGDERWGLDFRDRRILEFGVRLGLGHRVF
ncbi:hypothetical protein PIB30_039884 [Stylosanthes scabra]|uniref:ferroxidase n=1 Tax=Stylosanthes scabra TaxID=79078 RepID=A0ABU6WCL1_9FABA|nr:hypothetical protein [Stylosanthes scabra]